MAVFKDSEGNEWRLAVTVGSMSRIKTDAGVDLMSILKTGKDAGEFLFADPGALVRIFWVLCEKQAKERNITPEGFAELFDGPTLESATESLLMAVADFFPRARVGQALKTSLTRGLKEMDEAMVGAISKASAGTSPEPSESMPTP